MARYVYSVILTPEEKGGYSANFPDLKSCYTQGDDLADTLEMAKDVLTLVLCEMEDTKQTIPVPSKQEEFRISKHQIVSLVSADTTEYRKLYNNKAIKKTLTIPTWLNTIAEENEINFSALLQKALKEELRIVDAK